MLRIRDRLIALGRQHDMHVMLVRLPSAWPAGELEILDRIALDVLEHPEVEANFRFVNLESCAREAAPGAGFNFSEEYRWHPGPQGHRVIAECLEPFLVDALIHGRFIDEP